MIDLSPAAQAAWVAYLDQSELDETSADLPALAAAIRALASQCLHETPKGIHGHHAKRYMLAGELRAIAAEIDAMPSLVGTH